MKKLLLFCLILISAAPLFAQDTINDLEQKAQRAIANKDFDKAAEFYSRAIVLEPDNAAAYLARALVHNEKTRVLGGTISTNNKSLYDSIVKDFDKALELEPYNFTAYLERGLLKNQHQKNESSVLDYNRALACTKDSMLLATALGFRGLSYTNMRLFDKAVSDFKISMELNSENLTVFINLGGLYMEMGRLKEAEVIYKRALKQAPDFFPAKMNYAFLLTLLERYPEAIAIFDEMIAAIPGEGSLYNNRGFARFKAGDIAGGLEDINRSIGMNATNSYAFRNRALVFLETGEKENACRDLYKAEALGFSLSYGPEVKELIEKHCLGK